MLGELTFFLGLQVIQDDKWILISQAKYLRDKLKQFGMEDCKPICTHVVIGCELSKDDESLEVNQSMYHSMIDNLLYLTASRPNITQAIGLVSRFQANPKETHLNVVKRIFKYLWGTLDYGLWYPKGKKFNLITFTDVDWTGSISDKKITLVVAHFLGYCLVSWESKKQIYISLSTTKVEYITTTTCCANILWDEPNSSRHACWVWRASSHHGRKHKCN